MEKNVEVDYFTRDIREFDKLTSKHIAVSNFCIYVFQILKIKKTT